MIIKAWVLEEGRRQEKRKGEREALREHFSYDGLHTPISPMKSFPPWKELKEGCVGQCVSKTSQDHPKNSMPCHRGRAAVTHVEALTRPPHKEQTPLGLSSGLMQWKHSHKDTWFLLRVLTHNWNWISFYSTNYRNAGHTIRTQQFFQNLLIAQIE